MSANRKRIKRFRKMGTASKDFSFREFEATDYAQFKYGNIIRDVAVRNNIVELTTQILQPMRDAWGKPLQITSGYRCPELNAKVGGSPTSAHLAGLAADIRPAGEPSAEECRAFVRWALKWLIDSGVDFDQALDEHNSKGAIWLHIGLRDLEGRQRREIRLGFRQ